MRRCPDSLPNWRRLNRMRLLVKLLDLLLVFGLNHSSLEFHGGSNFAGSDGEFVWHDHDFLYGLELRQALIHMLDNSPVEFAHLIIGHEFGARIEIHLIS